MIKFVLALTCSLTTLVAFSQELQNSKVSKITETSQENDGYTPAPGRGILEETKDIIKTQPIFFDFEKMEFKLFKLPNGETLPGVRRKVMAGANFKNTWWELKKGAVLPLHSHQMEQITHVLSGKLSVYSQGKKYTLTSPNQYLLLLPNVPHEFVAEEDSIIEDLQTGEIGNYTGGFK